ncbi:hypothetical protein H6P81_015949 [Aristolochia fimbriata]|uniref:DUF4378 domain-containing protein n=1 Tax=Aristolochia fimbriata TaxID=158543 RepID=A0AAV7E8P5_ARIFI|nr:hypothetical protein H6P81_015949 [Aristolochia fimbriata]
MGRQLQRNLSSLENQPPSCAWGIFHLFNFHQRLNMGKTLPDGKNSGGKHAGGSKGSKTKLGVSKPDVTHELKDQDDDSSRNYKDEENSKSKSKRHGKKTVRARIKLLIEKEMAKERGKKRINPALAPRLQRLYSIHHMEGDNLDFPEEGPSQAENSEESTEPCSRDGNYSRGCNDQPLDLQNNCCKICEACGVRNTPETVNTDLSELGRQLLERQAHLRDMLEEVKQTLSDRSVSGEAAGEVGIAKSQKILDVVEAFNNNQELFIKMLEEKGSSAPPDHIRGSSCAEALLTNPSSIPGGGLSGTENKNHANLKHKEQNTGSPGKKRGKLISGNKSTESTVGGSSEATGVEWTPLRTDERVEAEAESSVSLTGLPRNKKSRFKSIKRKLAHAIKGSKKERHRVALDGILHKIPYGHDVSEELKSVTEREREGSLGRSAASNIASDPPRIMTRSSSLSESLDRYSQLFESSFKKEPTIHRARTLKLSSSREEDAILLDRKPSIGFGRVRSLPTLHSFQLEGDAEKDETRQTLASSVPPPVVVGKVAADVGSNSQGKDATAGELSRLGLSSIEEDETSYNGGNAASDPIGRAATEQLVSDGGDDIRRNDNKKDWSSTCDEIFHGTKSKETNFNKAPAEPSPISVLNSSFLEDILFPEKNSSSGIGETSELKPGRTTFSEAEASRALSGREEEEAGVREEAEEAAAVEAFTSSSSDEVIDHSESLLVYTEFDEIREEPEFKYVREILRRAGFSGSELLGSWYAPQQPLDPRLFDELASQQIQYDASGKVASLEAYLEHLLLFDLLNEALMEVYERSSSSSSSSYQSLSRPMPVGYRVVEEVWSVVSWHLNFVPQVDTLVEYVVARDLNKYDGWMNLQLDVESLALDLEDWILDDLLDEVIPSSSSSPPRYTHTTSPVYTN